MLTFAVTLMWSVLFIAHYWKGKGKGSLDGCTIYLSLLTSILGDLGIAYLIVLYLTR